MHTYFLKVPLQGKPNRCTCNTKNKQYSQLPLCMIVAGTSVNHMYIPFLFDGLRARVLHKQYTPCTKWITHITNIVRLIEICTYLRMVFCHVYLHVKVFVGKVLVVLALYTSCMGLSVGSTPFGKFLLTFFYYDT